MVTRPHVSPAATPVVSLDDPALYISRELSWVEFNDRVLEEALDAGNPLMERFKFVAIYGTNLDEFFMIRVAAIKQQIEAQVVRRSEDGRTPTEHLGAISERLRRSLPQQMRVLNEELLPALEREGIRLLRVGELDEGTQIALERTFDERVFPVLTPLAVDSGHPFPYISNLSLSLAVELEETTREGVELHFARIKIPPTLPRFVPVEDGAPNERRFVLLEDLIAHHLDGLFPGLRVRDSYLFRVTRDADLDLQEDEADDLLRAIESELRRRRFGEPVRLEIERGMPDYMREFLCNSLELQAVDCYEIEGLMALSDLWQLVNLPGYDHLRDKPFLPAIPKRLIGATDIFAQIRESDILLHHPYESFDPVIQFLQQAAEDEKVLAIKATLYRTSGKNSPIVRALLTAAENEKQVAVVIELKARFDEENNIEWAKRLERAGAHVVYGFANQKVHAKTILVVRQDDDGLRRYMHFGTGNYNEKTAKLYTDLSLFTSRSELGLDDAQLFNALTGFSKVTDYEDLWVAPVTLHRELLASIERETEHARAGRPAGIRAKINALTEGEVVRALYRASQAGVAVDLLVRGMCVLRPGVPGVSENIRVRSIVGRFLEHSRMYVFENGGEMEVHIGSADWMGRNLDRRVELAVPVLDPVMAQTLASAILRVLLSDNVKSRELHLDGTYRRRSPASGEMPIDAQRVFLTQAQALG
ncbi:MAG: polyphosphate kinase 1 [Candidatus Eremiobacteraeota bacterium]|nr:polyphosphate kinase 1 [Candidatus Eremiobacteraeota bacterium]MBV9055470.1 polyphosphate kinase 1 [Candidatus Eremiobacteraeota bacterium]MBV9699820.1 polyphosphate kinase 1 [Candidatus Eremiobacteraeota bacterium]